MTTANARILKLRPAPVADDDGGQAFSIDAAITLVLDRVRAKGGSEATIVSYGQHLRRFRDFCASRGVVAVAAITDDLIVEHWQWLKAHSYADSTVRGAGVTIRRMLLLCDKTERVQGAARTWRKVAEDMPREARELEPEFAADDLTRLLAALAANRHALRDIALCLLLVDTGLRISEALGLRVRDVDLTSGRVRVVSGKGRKSRTDFIGQETRAALTAYLEERRYYKPDDPLWRSAELKPLSAATVRKTLRLAAARAGVENCHPHRFRKTFAVNFLRAGGSVLECQRLMGHETLTMLYKVYVRLVDDDLQRSHAQHGPVAALGLRRPEVVRDGD